ncbi:EamA family transporter [Variovorax sp. PCZ-1]|uniref:EamA family transporter n=1 Tax=Variovorax sp. PCZ-1 TaxID=2835533 RepID=UPI001BCFEA86|nr:EamA family transporter [Variovorax sp. PCZ-1]MBS7809086.1 EamA family transporter [Variovorax sp. PCZ-1]
MTSPPSFSARDSAFALFIVVSWGLNFVVMKWGLASWTPFQMGAARYLLAAFPLLLFIRPRGLPWRWVLLYGVAQGIGQFGFLFTALKLGMTASLASVLMQTQVFFTALFGLLFLQERLNRAQLVGLAMAALALMCFAMHFITGSTLQSGVTVLSFALNLCAAASWAASNIVARKAQQAAPGYDALAFVVWSSAVPIIPFVLLSAALDTGSVPAVIESLIQAPWTAWAAAAYLGWIATIAAYAMWTNLLKRHAANRVAPLSLGVPVVGIAAGMLLLGESVSAWQWAGVACVGAALIIVLFGAKFISQKGRLAN